MNEQEVLDRFTYDDEAEIMSRISSVDRKDYRANKDIINEIVLWKMNRRPQVQEKLIVFPIIDQRAYRELYGKEFPGNLTKVEALTKLYLKYVEDCYIYQQRNCPEIPYAKIDKVLYQLDKEKGFKVKY